MVPSHDDDANQTPDLLDLNVPRGRLSNRRDDWMLTERRGWNRSDCYSRSCPRRPGHSRPGRRESIRSAFGAAKVSARTTALVELMSQGIVVNQRESLSTPVAGIYGLT
jgi:hypothetical protein